jgi:hypothetical protein
MRQGMSVNDFVLVQGMHDTQLALRRWNDQPWRMLRPWATLSLLIALCLLAAVYVIAKLSTPDPTHYLIPGYNSRATFHDYLAVLYRNSLVLALHAMACVAGFMAGSSLPLSASKRSGLSRWVHEKAGRFAIAFVIGATTFSLSTQAYVLGHATSTVSAQLGMSPAKLLLALSIHAIPELTALFLPLAAWVVASRRGDWHKLLAATVVTVGLAVPVLLAACIVEVYVTPRVILTLV